MKQFAKYIIGLSVVSLLFSSCKEDEQPVTGFSLDQEEVVFSDPNGGFAMVNISTDAEWQASTEASWLQLAPGNGVGSATMELKADSSVLASIRETQVRFIAKGAGVKNLTVKQFGYKKEILLEKSELTIESNAPFDDRFFEVTVTANVKFKIEIPEGVDWLEEPSSDIDLDYGERPRTGKLRFGWHINAKEEQRVAEIKFVPETSKDGEEVFPATLKVIQKSAPVLTDDRAGDSLAVLTIYQSMNGLFGWDATENMRNWNNVTLWKSTDKIDGQKIPAEMVGRIRSASFNLFSTKESIPYQVTQLRFAESLSFFSNANRETKEIVLGPEICVLLNGHPKNPVAKDGSHVSYLKELNLNAFGIKQLPEGVFSSKTLESLELSSNNFVGTDWYEQVNKTNFPALKSLQLTNLRMKTVVTDLTQKGEWGFRWETSFGNNDRAYSDKNDRNFFKKLLAWDNLERLSLSVGLLEGELPSDEELQKAPLYFEPYTASDFAEASDTLKDAKEFLISKRITKVWPKMKSLSINLNFLTGKMPNWLLYHPGLDLWNPYSLIFPQELKGKNSLGQEIGFEGKEPKSMRDYSNLTPELGYDEFVKDNSYYSVYPQMDPNYKPGN